MTGPVTPADAWSLLASSARLGLESVVKMPDATRDKNWFDISEFFAQLGLDLTDPQTRLTAWATLEVCLDGITSTVQRTPGITDVEISAMGHPIKLIAASLADQLPHEAVEAVAARRAR